RRAANGRRRQKGARNRSGALIHRHCGAHWRHPNQTCRSGALRHCYGRGNFRFQPSLPWKSSRDTASGRAHWALSRARRLASWGSTSRPPASGFRSPALKSCGGMVRRGNGSTETNLSFHSIHVNGVSLRVFATQYLLSQGVFYQSLNRAFERPRAILRIEALRRNGILSGGGDLEEQASSLETLFQPPKLHIHDRTDLFSSQAPKHHALIESIEEFRAELRS